MEYLLSFRPLKRGEGQAYDYVYETHVKELDIGKIVGAILCAALDPDVTVDVYLPSFIKFNELYNIIAAVRFMRANGLSIRSIKVDGQIKTL